MSADSFDIEHLRATFLVEAAELVASLESGVLALEACPTDLERVHQLFRDAHSLKGGAATVGWTELVGLTHKMESLLDRWREGRLVAQRAHFDVLLRSADILRNALADRGEVKDAAAAAALVAELGRLLEDQPAAAPAPVAAPVPTGGTFHIKVAPRPDAFDLGGDPLLVTRELRSLSTSITITSDLKALPALADLVPERCYFAWTIELEAKPDVDAARIAEAFSFIDADLQIDQPQLAAVEAPAATVAAAAQPAAAAPAATQQPDSTLRVATEKVDALVDLVGELVISHSVIREMVRTGGASVAALQEAVLKTERHLRELQERVMSVRMVPVSALFSRAPRVVRELSSRLGKQVRLDMAGGETELDKVLVEQLVDPLLHLVRNALDHGLEAPEARLAAGKPAVGTIRLDAHARGGSVFIEVKDDGRGLQRDRILAVARARGMVVDENPSDEQVYALIAAPGFSTAEKVTDVSGRGVGLDVVRRNIEQMGGDLSIVSEPGSGTTFRLRLPLTLTIMDGLQVQAAGQTCVMPMVDIAFSTQLDPKRVRSLAGLGDVVDLDGETLPLISLAHLLRRDTSSHGGLAVVVQAGTVRYALRVDALLGQAQIVVKSIEAHFRRVPGMIGATILGDGSVALILDAQSLASVAGLRTNRTDHGAGSYLS